ncbi:hypothetical protein PJL18_02695 [Paenarthrobacter nicotinovorans]|nr:hypothetical protein [Paenarthrobacter nicotinovorans]
MRRHPGRHLRELEIVLELLALGLHALLDAGDHAALLPQAFPEVLGEVRVLPDALHQNGTGTGERRGGVLDGVLAVQVLGGFGGGVQLRVGEKDVGQGLKTGFAGDLRFGAPLGFEGKVDVFEPGFGIGPDDGGLQFRGQLALRGNRLEDGLAAFFQLTKVSEALFEVTQLGVIERPGDFLAVAGDEGDGGSGVEQFHRGLDLPGFDAEFFCDLCVDGGVG